MSLLNFLQNNNKTINAKGISGVNYRFIIRPKITFFSSEPGIYIFLRSEANSVTPIYIGETKDFDNRIGSGFRDHDRYECINKNRYTHIATLIVYGGKQKRLDIETDLRNNYTSSVCNQQGC